MLLLIDFNEFLLEVFGYTVGKLLDSVYSGGFKQLGKLSGHAFDAEQVSVVDPCQYQFFGYSGLLGYLFTPFLGLSGLEEVFGGADAGGIREFRSIGRTYAFNLVNLISHGIQVFRLVMVMYQRQYGH